MRMERVASRLRELGRDTWDASTTAVVVVGADDEDLARQLRALVSPEVRVRALSVRATIDGLPPFTVAVFAGMPTSAADPEQELARMAQPFLRLGSGATAVLPADNEAAGLLAEIVPPHARVLRVGATEGKTALLRATLDALATVLASNARVP